MTKVIKIKVLVLLIAILTLTLGVIYSVAAY